MDAETQKRVDSLPASTGKSLAEWFTILQAAGLEKHGETMSLLKTEHGVSHGFANFIALMYRNQGGPEGDELIEKQYQAKPALRPIYDALAAAALGFGGDVEIVPKQASVSLRRSKQFALISPATKSRVDVGINLKGEPGASASGLQAACARTPSASRVQTRSTTSSSTGCATPTTAPDRPTGAWGRIEPSEGE